MRLAAALLALVLAGCAPRTELVLVVDTLLPDTSGVTSIEVLAYSDRTPPFRERIDLTSGAGAAQLPFVRSLRPRGSTDVEVGVAVIAYDDVFGPLYARHVRTRFVPGETRLLHVVLAQCALACAPDHACSERGCVPIDVPPESLPPFTTVPPRAMAGCGLADLDAGALDCDGQDGDCDGVIDEAGELDRDLSIDTAHCGRCGHACADGASCTMGLCSGEEVRALAAGSGHTCALREDASVVCWGDATFGQTTALGGSETGVHLVDGLRARALAAGTSHTCAIDLERAVWCWGDSFSGQCGVLSAADRTPLTRVEGVSGALAIAAGAAHTCVLVEGGEVLCWGADAHGQLGRGGASDDTPTPARVLGVSGALAIAAGAFHTCAATPTEVRCWGDGAGGQLGAGATGDTPTPVVVTALEGATRALSAGLRHTCALDDAGVVRCWGDGASGVLGRGDRASSPDPEPVLDLGGPATVLASAPTSSHACAVRSSDASLRCWGAGASGQLGSEDPSLDRARLVPEVPDAVAIALGGDALGHGHTCAADRRGQVLCFGDPSRGQTGARSRLAEPGPARVETRP